MNKKIKTKMKISEKKITPDMAKKWLENGMVNRKLSQNNVLFLYNQMREGNWMLTGDPIKFSKNGKLLDGQHRLQAIVKYGQPINIMVADDCEEKIFQVLDTGKNRSAADVLQIAGHKYSVSLAAVARAIILYKNGIYNNANGYGKFKSTNQNILEFNESHPELLEIVQYCQIHVYQHFRFIPLATLCMIYWILSKKNQTKCDEFFGKYATGIDLGEKNPIRHLRERLLKDIENKSRLKQRDKAALLIYTWNNFIQGKQISQLLLPRNYTFPKPV